jgi:hypothetical protein
MSEKYQNEAKPQSFNVLRLGAPASRWQVSSPVARRVAGETPALPGNPRDSHAQCVKISRIGRELVATSCVFSRFFDEKSFGTNTAKSFPEKGLTGKADSLEFADCLPNQ